MSMKGILPDRNAKGFSFVQENKTAPTIAIGVDMILIPVAMIYILILMLMYIA